MCSSARVTCSPWSQSWGGKASQKIIRVLLPKRGRGTEGCWAGTATDDHSVCSQISGGMDVQKLQQGKGESDKCRGDLGFFRGSRSPCWQDKPLTGWATGEEGHELAWGDRKPRVWSRIAHTTGALCMKELRLMRSWRTDGGRSWAYLSSLCKWRTFEREGESMAMSPWTHLIPCDLGS